MHRSYTNSWNFLYMVKPTSLSGYHTHTLSPFFTFSSTHHSGNYFTHSCTSLYNSELHALLEGIQPNKWQQLEDTTAQTLTKLGDVRVNISERLEMCTSTRTRSESERSIPHRSSKLVLQSSLKVAAYQGHLAQSLTEKNHQPSTSEKW